MANRRISEFPVIAGNEINEADLLTLVHVFEVDPTLRNKKITFTQFKDYLNSYYSSTSGATFSGNVTITGNFVVSGSSTLDSLIIPTQASPASASATGTTGQIVWDANYVYVCIATNTWKRVLLATW